MAAEGLFCKFLALVSLIYLGMTPNHVFGELVITPEGNFESSGEIGGPFTPLTMEYTLHNTESSSLFWGLTKNADWLDVSPTWSILAPDETLVVTVTINSQAYSLAGGVYSDSILFTDTLHPQPQSREVILTITAAPGVLQIEPDEGFDSSGEMGGPFSPAFKDYTVTNTGGSELFWGVSKAAGWLEVEPTWGQLDPDETVTVTARLNTAADSLGKGVYTDTLVFTNVTSSEVQNRAVTLTVLSERGLWVDPEQFTITLIQGTSAAELLTIGNNSDNEVNFQLRSHVVSGTANAPSPDQSADLAGFDFTQIADVPYKEGEILVRFAPGKDGKQRDAGDKQAVLSALGSGQLKKEFNLVPGLTVVSLPLGLTMEEALQLYNNTEGVIYAQPNYQVQALNLPNDSRFNELWGLNNTGQNGGKVDADIDAPEAWDIATGSREIVVAVIDTGVDYTHPDLAGNMWVNEPEKNGSTGVDDDGNGYIDDIYGYDFVNNDGNPMDDHYHGTHCAGTIGACGNNGTGVTGVNWQVKIMAIKFLNSAGSGWTDDAITCIEYSMEMGANLSSNSWGGGSYNQGLEDTIDAAGTAGMLFVAAAGNDSSNNDQNPAYPASYDCPSIISVMATDKNDNRSSFSNYGLTSVDLGAPGTDILSCEPGNGYQYLDGTSMATPHVSGACALVWSQNPTLSNLEVKQLLIDTVDPTLSGKCVSGGRLNLYNAVAQLNTPWITMEPEAGGIAPDGTAVINVTFDTAGMAIGTYQAEIVVQSDDAWHPEIIIPVTMHVVPDDLTLTPAEDFESGGGKGGPFTPASMIYTLANTGSVAHAWEAVKTGDWFDISVTGGILDPGASQEIEFSINSAALTMDPGLYTSTVAFRNLDSGSVKYRTVSLEILPPDAFTENFESDDLDLAYKTITFRPDGSGAYYAACLSSSSAFPVDPAAGVNIALGDDDFAEIVPTDGVTIPFYGENYDRFYVGSNGYITFTQGDTEYDGTLENHFSLPRISALFTDLVPPDSRSIRWQQGPDRIAVTWQNIPVWDDKNAKNSFQMELFLADGMIRITYLNLSAAEAVAGLSQGHGLPYGFIESNLNGYLACCPCGDLDGNSVVDLSDMVSFLTEWLRTDCTGPDWCNFADTNRDSAVDVVDFSPLSSNWLSTMNKPIWSEPVNIPELNDGSYEAFSPSLSRDQLTIYFYREVAGQNYHLVEATRTVPGGTFASERLISELYDGDRTISPWVSSDGLRLYYAEDEISHEGEYTIMMAERPTLDDLWTVSKTFSEIHENGYLDQEPSLTEDELTIFWISTRPGATGTAAIWVATRESKDDPFTNVANVTELNSNMDSGNCSGPCIMPDGLTIYFGSKRDGNTNGQIYKATRKTCSDPFSTIELIEQVSDPVKADLVPYVSPDEKSLYLFRYDSGIWVSYIGGWSTPQLRAELNSTDYPAMGPCLTRDGLTIYYYLGVKNANWHIVEARRSSLKEPFVQIRMLNEIYDGDRTITPWISSDELRLYYAEDAISHEGEYTLMMAERATKDDLWTVRFAFSGIHMNGYTDHEPSLSDNELTIYWLSTRPGGYGSASIWMATRNSIDEPFDSTTVRNVSELNTNFASGNSKGPCLMPDGLTIFFSSKRDGQSIAHIFKATRPSVNEPFGNIERFGPCDPSIGEWSVSVSVDEKEIFFKRSEEIGILSSYLQEEFQYEPCLPK